MAQKEIQRVTMFKVGNPDDIPLMLERYNILSKDSKKNGKPYILSLKAGLTNPSDPRSNGFTFAAMSRFANIDDMKYYDDEDVAHQELKKHIRPVVQGVMTVYFEDAL